MYNIYIYSLIKLDSRYLVCPYVIDCRHNILIIEMAYGWSQLYPQINQDSTQRLMRHDETTGFN